MNQTNEINDPTNSINPTDSTNSMNPINPMNFGDPITPTDQLNQVRQNQCRIEATLEGGF